MDTRIVQSALAVTDPQESSALLKGLLADAPDVEQLHPIDEVSVMHTVLDDIVRQSGRESGHVGQQGRRCRVDVDADGVDGALHHAAQILFENGPFDVVLVQSDAEVAGIDLSTATVGLGYRRDA